MSCDARFGGAAQLPAVAIAIAMIVSVFVGPISVLAQDGFLSIDCGSTDGPYTDSLGIIWVPDDAYILTGQNNPLADILSVDGNVENSHQLRTFRFFPDVSRSQGPGSKHCYELPTTPGVAFLLRAMFLHGVDSSALGDLPISFDIAVNGTVWSSLTFSASDNLTVPEVREGIFAGNGSVTSFCLLPIDGVAFVSSLEIRKLDVGGVMYDFAEQVGEKYLTYQYRFNLGASPGTPTVRYPDDSLDRFWFTPGSWSENLLNYDGSQSTSVKFRTSATVNNVPLIVMETAWMYDDGSYFFVDFPIPSVNTAYVGTYFLELSPNASASNVRELNMTLDGFNVLVNVSLEHAFMEYYPDWTVNGAVNITVRPAPGSKLGGMMNAIEIYSQDVFNNSITYTNDVTVLSQLQTTLNLTSWQGDPCFPVSWDWVGCNTSTSTARVTKLLLSAMNLSTTIPAIISNLNALTEIHLDNNNFTGSIPDSLSTLEDLTLLALQNNQLSGTVPASLLNRPSLTLLDSGNVNLGVTAPTPSSSKKGSSNIVPVVIGVVAGAVVLILVALVACYCLIRRRNRKTGGGVVSSDTVGAAAAPSRRPPSSSVQPDLTRGVGYFPLVEVLAATNGHAKKIGEGSYGPVYFGTLPDGREVAVKVNKVQSNQGKDEFINEVSLLTRVHHRNLVSLIGFCNDGEELILIYEYQSNGTLHDHLHGQRRGVNGSVEVLDWKTRLDIAWNAAKGLEYLHTGCIPKIIHRDVKSSNILLNQSLMAKMADFGLSKSDDGHTAAGGFSTVVKGTPGYLDPEYHNLQKLTMKSDVFSFGIVLLEIITGKTPFWRLPDQTVEGLVELVHESVETNNLEAIVDPALEGNYRMESVWKLVDIALSSVETRGVNRPDMTQVVHAISEARDLETSAQSSLVEPSGPLSSYQTSYA